LDRKDCVYDILATQDLDMTGAYWRKEMVVE
jgi:hypothetical protein